MGTLTRPDVSKTIEVDTDIWPMINCGTYGTYLDMDNVCRLDMLCDDMHKSQVAGFCGKEDFGTDVPYSYVSDYNTERYSNLLIECAIPYISDAIESVNSFLGGSFLDSNIKKTGVKFVSPREYNFRNDRMDIVVTVLEYNKLIERLLRFFNEEIYDSQYYSEAESYIEYNWESRSGFASFMPQSIEELSSLLQGILDGNGDVYDEERTVVGAISLVYSLTECAYEGQDFFEESVFQKAYCEGLIEIKNEFPEFFKGMSVEKINELLFDAFYSPSIGHAWKNQTSQNVELKNDYDKFVNYVWKNYDSLEELMEDITQKIK